MFTKERKRNILKVLLFLLIIAAFSLSVYAILRICGINDQTIIDFIKCDTDKPGEIIASKLTFLGLYVAITVILCFVPMVSMTLIAVAVAVYKEAGDSNIEIFLLCLAGVVTSSIIMDLIGRFGGTKAIIKLVGEKDYNNAQALVKEKGTVYVPVMYLLPLFPDDAICMVCGATGIKFWVHLLFIVLFRGIGCATIIFGINIIPEEITSFNPGNTLWDYIEVITILIFWIYVLLQAARALDKYLTKRLKKKQDTTKAEEIIEQNNQEVTVEETNNNEEQK